MLNAVDASSRALRKPDLCWRPFTLGLLLGALVEVRHPFVAMPATHIFSESLRKGRTVFLQTAMQAFQVSITSGYS